MLDNTTFTILIIFNALLAMGSLLVTNTVWEIFQEQKMRFIKHFAPAFGKLKNTENAFSRYHAGYRLMYAVSLCAFISSCTAIVTLVAIKIF